MANIKFSSFIVLDKDASLKKISRETDYSYTMDGQVIFEVGAMLPVIKSFVGCLGIAKVTRFVVTEENTTVYFTGIDSKRQDYSVLYDLYRMSVTTDDDDPYGMEDSIIPGIASGRKKLRASSLDKDDDILDGASFLDRLEWR